MVQDPPAQENIADQPVASVHGRKRGLPFGKKHGKWGLGMFSIEKSHQPLPPVDETSPAVVFQSRKRSQSDGSDSKSIRQPSPIREQPQDPRDAKKLNKKEAQRLHREAELEKRKMLERNAREQARAVLLKRQQMLRKNVGDDLEWSKAPTEIEAVRQPSSGPVRRDHPNGNGNMRTVGAAAGKFVMPSVNEPPPERDPREREWRGPSAAKARRREFDDDHSMSSSDVHSISRMSSISFATVDSDPGPTRLRNRPSLYGISRMTSRSSLRTSFDDFPPSARSSNSYSYEGQLAHDFRTQACVTSHLPGSLSPPPLHMLSLSPAVSPSSPPGLQPHQHKDDLFAHTQSPLFLSISPRFHGSASHPQSPVDANGQLPPLSPSPYDSPSGYTPSSEHTPKSAKSIMNPIFRVVSYEWDSSHNLVPDTVHQPSSMGATKMPMLNTHSLPPFSELDAVAGAGEYPPPHLSPIQYTNSEGP
jgi:meiosis induction protein kinase IME2/SME1